MTEESLDLRQLAGIFRRNRVAILVAPVACLLLGIAIAFVLPKRFKSTAVLNIQASYFQNPLISDLIAQVNDASELQAQRLSLLRLAMSTTFIDQLGAKYQLVKAPQGSTERTVEAELFGDSVEYYSLNATNFQINVSHGSPETAQQIAQDVLSRMRAVLIDERYSNLTKTRDAINSHVQNLGRAIKNVSNPSSLETLSEELAKIEVTLRGLLTKFSDSHPEVVKLRRQEAALRTKIGSSKASPQSQDSSMTAGAIALEPTQEVFNELIKKLSYLTVVLDMERDKTNVSYLGVIEQPSLPIRPFFPDKRMFATIGLGLGVLLSMLLVFLSEIRRNMYVTPFDAAKLLDTPLLGELPLLESDSGQFTLAPPHHSGSRPTLPGSGLRRLPST